MKMTQQDAVMYVDELLSRGVGELIDPDGMFREKLIKKIKGEYTENIVIKFGVDPTRPDIHLGHAVVLRKLRQFQDLGCKVIFLIGDFTSMIGDPTGKSKVRPEITFQEIEHNMNTYLQQVNKILRTDVEVFSWIRNSDWFTGVSDLGFDVGKKVELVTKKDDNEIKLSLDANSLPGKALMFEKTRMQVKESEKNNISVVTVRTFLATLRKITYGTLIQRDMFQDRISGKSELYMHEMLYPILQGIDSSILAKIYGSCDLEVGGTDQHFNMLMARDIMKNNQQEQQSVISFELLEGLDGNEKMSKSLDNYVGISDEPNEMYGKIMSLPDHLITRYFTLCTYTPVSVIDEIGDGVESGKLHPRDSKMQLAKQIVSMYHGEEAAEVSQQYFIDTFRNKKTPDNIPEIKIQKGEIMSVCLVGNGFVKSKSDFRRLVDAKAIHDLEAGESINDYTVTIQKDYKIRIGKKTFVKIIAI